MHNTSSIIQANPKDILLTDKSTINTVETYSDKHSYQRPITLKLKTQWAETAKFRKQKNFKETNWNDYSSYIIGN